MYTVPYMGKSTCVYTYIRVFIIKITLITVATTNRAKIPYSIVVDIITMIFLSLSLIFPCGVLCQNSSWYSTLPSASLGSFLTPPHYNWPTTIEHSTQLCEEVVRYKPFWLRATGAIGTALCYLVYTKNWYTPLYTIYSNYIHPRYNSTNCCISHLCVFVYLCLED